jgi:phosphatidylserine/phosphatidylglycerophosphate/cardiolipin synthase-like enzyme
MRIFSILALALALLGFAAQAADIRTAQAAEPEIHYAPVENLEHIDIELIRSATKSVDMAAFTLTDWAIIAALKEAHTRGVTIRILLDPSQRQAYDKLAEMADIVRVKKRGRPLMHLKAYAIDGALLRTGSANLSPSGLKQQDNDLIILRDPVLAAKFEARFAEVYSAAEPMSGGEDGKDAEDKCGKPPNPACSIKGNMNAKGECIYHEPNDRDYCRVVMQNCDDQGKCAKGKRYFCSAAEAEAAGCRPPKR